MVSFRLFAYAFIAAAGFAAPSAHAATSQDAGQFISNIAEQALGVIKSGVTKDQKQDQLEKLFSGSVDIAWVGKFVLGQYWRQATDDQKQKYLAAYQEFLIRHYTSRFTDYNNGAFKILSTKDDGNSEFTVSMELKAADNSNDQPVDVDYRVRAETGGLKIFDVTVEGVSLITTQRSEFTSVAGNQGIDYLINQLQEKSKTGEF